ALHGERQEGGHPVVLGQARRRHRREAEQPEGAGHSTRARRGQGPWCARVAAVRSERTIGQNWIGADARADQSTCAGAADRRVVFEVAHTKTTKIAKNTKNNRPLVNFEPFVRFVIASRRPAAQQTCSGRAAEVTSRSCGRGCRPIGERKSHALERFSASEAS